MIATKLAIIQIKSYAADRASNMELLMLASDFKVNSRLKILKGISVEFMEYLDIEAWRKKGHLVYMEIVMLYLLLAPNCMILSISLMDSMVVLQRPLTKEY